jgi:adenylate cyclase
VTLLGFVTEVAERGRITKRFRAYVDPTLVNYVLENPDKPAFEGHEREMTVVFTDLKGFTALSEQLRGGIVKLLARYIELMVPVIRRNNGYVNKFIGDGILFFFGAPADNPNHAADALATLLEMDRALGPLNAELEAQDLPTLTMRAGVSTGTMFVGDAGPSFASDFTVLGDRVNLASRLESANKVTGTRNLITSRTIRLAGDGFLTRPVARLQVAGKREPVVVHELLGRKADVDARTVRLADLSTRLFEAFKSGDFPTCRATADELRREFGAAAEKLATLYLERCATAGAPDEQWDGHIALAEK